jgi:GDPmannose 4,6-dehydratase
VEEAGHICNLDTEWEGQNEQEKGFDRKTGKIGVQVNPKLYRPAEVELLLGNSRKAKETLDWMPKITFKDLCNMMKKKDRERIQKSKK